MYITDNFSVGMISHLNTHKLVFIPISFEDAKRINEMEKLESAIDRESILPIINSRLGLKLKVNCYSIMIKECETIMVAQYYGPELPKGATELPECAMIDLWLVYHML